VIRLKISIFALSDTTKKYMMSRV